MNAAEIATVLIVAAVLTILVLMFLQFRVPKEQREWEQRERQVIVRDLPSFEAIAPREKRSRSLEAANKR